MNRISQELSYLEKLGGEGVAMMWVNASYYRSYTELGRQWLDKNEHIPSLFVSHMLSARSQTTIMTQNKDQLVEEVKRLFLSKYNDFSGEASTILPERKLSGHQPTRRNWI